MIDSEAKEAFWGVVEACLVNIHKVSPRQARKLSTTLRARIESSPDGILSEIFYHAEPFDVACDLAGAELDIKQHRGQYDTILAQYDW